MMKKLLAIFVAVVTMISAANAQKVAIKTNLVSDAFLSPNIGVEIGLAPKWTLDIPVELNAWQLSHRRQWRHLSAQPEARYWFCERFAGNFIGVHAHGGWYNIGGLDMDFKFLGTDFSKLHNSRYQGWFAGAGISYGHAWILNEHWNIEAEIGIGWSYTRFDKFKCEGCGKKEETDKSHNYYGPTKAALSLVYLF